MWFLIVNPVAGNGKAARNWTKITKLLAKYEIQYEYIFTERSEQATELTINAIKKGFRKLIAVGGDGTNNEVMNGIFQQKEVPTTEITHAIIPIGTGNDWIKMHEIPNHIEQAIALIQKEKTTFQDIGEVDFYENGKPKKRYFMNVAGMAYDGYVAWRTTTNRSLIKGKLSYYWLIFKCLFEYKTEKGKVFFDNKEIENTFYTINIGLCKYSGGGMQFVPQAVADDGLFALTTAYEMPKLDVVFLTTRLNSGKIDGHPKVNLYNVPSVKVESLEKKPILLELDGEYVGGTPATFTMHEKALKFVCR